MSNKSVGNAGETKAAEYLQSKGFEIVARNWRTRRGEIDIIAKKEEILVFAEVKTLPSGNWETLAAKLNEIKRKRILETSKCFLLKYRQYNCNYIRYDVLVVDMPGVEPVYHIENAFSEYL